MIVSKVNISINIIRKNLNRCSKTAFINKEQFFVIEVLENFEVFKTNTSIYKMLFFSIYSTWSARIRDIFCLTVRIANTAPNKDKLNLSEITGSYSAIFKDN